MSNLQLASPDAARLLLLAAVRAGTLRGLGSASSGNYGHAGRPGDVGGSARAFHGTTIENAEKIKKEGLKPPSDDLRGRVFTTNKLDVALTWGMMRGKDTASGVAVVILKPEARMMFRPHTTIKNTFTTTEHVPPDLIKEVRIYKTEDLRRRRGVYPDLTGGSRLPYRTLEVLDADFLFVFPVFEPRVLGGSGSGNFGHAGRPGAVGGSGNSGNAAAELNTQTTRAANNTNPLAHPAFVIGAHDLNQSDVQRYVAAYGEEFTAAPLPADVRPGTPGECYRNASLLVMDREDLTYAEGLATKGGSGLAVLHAWGVDTAGNVVDPTIPDPQNWKYFGVRYDSTKYIASLIVGKFFGVLGSNTKIANRAMTTGGKKLR